MGQRGKSSALELEQKVHKFAFTPPAFPSLSIWEDKKEGGQIKAFSDVCLYFVGLGVSRGSERAAMFLFVLLLSRFALRVRTQRESKEQTNNQKAAAHLPLSLTQKGTCVLGEGGNSKLDQVDYLLPDAVKCSAFATPS